MTTHRTTRQPLRGQEIADAGLEGWRKVLNKLVVRYQTGDFNTGAALVTKIAEAADEANHHPDVDLRYPHLTVSLSSHDVGAITARDIRLARRISELAEEAGVSATAAGAGRARARAGHPRPRAVTPFWPALLGYDSKPDDDLVDGADRTPAVWFQETDSDAPDRQRWHLDVSVPHDVAEARLQAVLDAGGTLVDDARAPAFWVVADADGNRSCICTWQARD